MSTSNKIIDDMDLAYRRSLPKWVSLSKIKEGWFIQSKERMEEERNIPPPIFYVGNSNTDHRGCTLSVNMLCLHSYKWKCFHGGTLVLSKDPELTLEKKMSIIPYLDLEPKPVKLHQELKNIPSSFDTRAYNWQISKEIPLQLSNQKIVITDIIA